MTATNHRHRTAAELAGHDGFSLISNQKLLQLYAVMVECRLLEERMLELFPQSSLSDRRTSCTGQEAAMVAAAVDLTPGDSVRLSRHGFIFDLIQGKPPGKILSHPALRAPMPPPACSPHAAIGLALSHKTKNDGKLVLAYCDDEDDVSDGWEEALHVAAVHRLPMLFVRYSNRPASSASLKRLAGARKAGASGLPTIPVDGDDVVAVYRVATEAIAHARKGSGPTLIECGGALPGAGSVKSVDPISAMEAYLTRKGLFRAKSKSEATARFGRELDAACGALTKSHPLPSNSSGGILSRRR